MKVSLNWLKQYTNIQLSAEDTADVLTDIGLEVEGIETHDAVPGGLRGFVLGEVLTCEKFEVKDKQLSLCTVNIGTDSPAQIVCGAANVAAGQRVVVATVGTTLFQKDGTPIFQISSKKTYGHLSEGMICAEDELGIGESHDGIMVLDTDLPNGTLAADYFQLESDQIIEIGLTPNRSDATCHVGVAKDLAAALKINFNHDGVVTMPSVDAFKIDNQSLTIPVRVENQAACPRYTGVVISGVTVKESPKWLKDRLVAIGMNTRNNIVDITNFIMHELGQPLHAFDLNEIKGKEIIVKNVSEGTKFLSLKKNELGENVTLNLTAEDLMICDAEGNGMCIAGVIGSPTSGVSDSTTSIFLESAHFHPMTTRRSGTRHNTRTDSSKVFEKGSDPNLCVYALKRAALLIQELAGGEIASEIVDIYPTPIEKPRIEVFYDNITRLIGEEIPKDKLKAILEALEIEMINPQGKSFIAVVPTNKADVLREVDVIEEILRIYGFNRVGIPNQIRSAITESIKPDPTQIKIKISAQLAASGYNEAMSLSLSQSKYYKDFLPTNDENLVYIANSINVHLDIMRASMLFSGLEAIAHNQNRQNADLKLFEFGKTYVKNNDKYQETNRLALFLTGKKQTESWLAKDSAADYYDLKSVVENVLARLGITNCQMTAIQEAPFSYALRLHRGQQVFVEFGKIQPNIVKKMDIKQAVFYADFNWDTIMSALKKAKTSFKDLSKYPTVRRDLALVIDEQVNFNEIEAIAKKTAKNLLAGVNLFDVFTDKDKLGEGKKSYAVSFLFEDTEKTLNDKEIDATMAQLMKLYEEKLGALIRK
jgi:phenylalanyl-tRNA synthetase beta chain